MFAVDLSITVTTKCKINNYIIKFHEIDTNNPMNLTIKWLDMNNLRIHSTKTN